MGKVYSSTAKVILASLLAVGASLPAYQLTAQAAEEQLVQSVQQNSLRDGVYEIAFKTWKINENVVSGMDNRFAKTAKLLVKDSKMTVQMTIHTQNDMIEKLQIKKGADFIDMETVEGSKETEQRVVSFPVENLHDMVFAHVYVNLFGTVVEQDFRIQLIAPEDSLMEQVPVKIYTSGTADRSPLQKHIAETADITKSAAATAVSLTVLDGTAIHSLRVEGTEVLPDESKMYTFEVQDLKKLVNAEITIRQNGSLSSHPVQLRFEVKGAETVVHNPFSDIETDENKDAILNLLSRNIIKSAETFNPRDAITRGQFALMIARTLDLPPAEDAGFTDVRLLADTERAYAINALAKAGIVKKGENFRPNEKLTRQQSALILYRAIGYVNAKELQFGSTLIYADQDRITDKEARKAFALLYAGGMMTGNKDSSGNAFIEPNKEMKRTHVAKALNGSLKYITN